MSVILSLMAKDFRIFWSDKVAVVLSLVVPMMLITIFGFAMGGAQGGSLGIRVLVVDEAQTETSARLIRALEEERALRIVHQESDEDRAGGEERARELLANDASNFRFAVIFPEGFEGENFGFRLKYLYNPRYDVENQAVTGLIQKVFYTHGFPILQQRLNRTLLAESGPEAITGFQNSIAELISEQFGAPYVEVRGAFQEGTIFPDMNRITGDSGDQGPAQNPFSEMLDIESEQVAGLGLNPAVQSVGGMTVMFLLFAMAGSASSLFEEREAAIFQRLLGGPVTRTQILWSKFGFLLILGILQVTVLVGFGHLLFDVISSTSQLLPLAVVCIFGAAASTGFGMILAAICRTSGQASGFGTLLILSMSALGGAMFPPFMLPDLIRDYVSKGTPVYWMMDGIYKVLWESRPVAELGLNLMVLAAFAVVTLAIAIWRFRRGEIFR